MKAFQVRRALAIALTIAALNTACTSLNKTGEGDRKPAQAAQCVMHEPFYSWAEADAGPGRASGSDERAATLQKLGYSSVRPGKDVDSAASYVLDLHDGESGLLVTAGSWWRSGFSSVIMVTRHQDSWTLSSVQADSKSGNDATLLQMFQKLPSCH